MDLPRDFQGGGEGRTGGGERGRAWMVMGRGYGGGMGSEAERAHISVPVEHQDVCTICRAVLGSMQCSMTCREPAGSDVQPASMACAGPFCMSRIYVLADFLIIYG